LTGDASPPEPAPIRSAREGDAARALQSALATSRAELVGALARRAGGDLFAAEDALGDAVSAALHGWPSHGVPERPAAWLFAVAARRLAAGGRDAKRAEDARAARDGSSDPNEDAMVRDARLDFGSDDDTLRLVFACCHPALSPEARVALTLNAVQGLDAAAIAAAFLVDAGTMQRRITRAKQKIRDAGIEFTVPSGPERDARMLDVLKVVELVFNEGYAAARGASLDAPDLAGSAVDTARSLARIAPDEPEVLGLLALVLFTHARRAARTARDGSLVLLADQDRALWDRALIDEGSRTLGRAVSLGGDGRYVLRAALSAEHARAPSAEATRWDRIVALYDGLLAQEPSGVVALNRAVAVGEASGPAAMLSALDAIAGDPELAAAARSHYFHAARADGLTALGRIDDARRALVAAIAAAHNGAERAELSRRLDALPDQ